METMNNIVVPETLQEFVLARVAEGGYKNVNEYVRALIRADQKNQAREVLDAEITKGINSGPAVPMTQEDWDSIRAEVIGRHEARSK